MSGGGQGDRGDDVVEGFDWRRGGLGRLGEGGNRADLRKGLGMLRGGGCGGGGDGDCGDRNGLRGGRMELSGGEEEAGIGVVNALPDETGQ